MQSIRPVLKSELADVFQLEQAIFGDHCYPDFSSAKGLIVGLSSFWLP